MGRKVSGKLALIIKNSMVAIVRGGGWKAVNKLIAKGDSKLYASACTQTDRRCSSRS